MKTCAQVKEDISAYLDGELPRDEECQIEEHLRECQECQQIRQEFQDMWHYLDQYQLETVPASHITRFYQLTLPTYLFRRQQQPQIHTRWYWLSAAALVGIFLGLIAFHGIFIRDRQASQDLLAELKIVENPQFELIANLEILENYEVFKYHTPEMLGSILHKRRK